MTRAPAPACEWFSFSISRLLLTVLLGLLVTCGLGDGLEVRASSAPYDLDIYGTLSGELSSPAADQTIGLELTADRLTLEAELQAQLPTESGYSLSADASVLLLNSTSRILDETLSLRATLNSRMSIHPDTLLDISLDSEARWGPVIADFECQIDTIQSHTFSDPSDIQEHASIGFEVDVLELLLEEDTMPQLRMTSFTQIEARESGLLGKQSFKAEFSGIIGSWSDTAAEHRTIEGALSLNASVLPSVEAEARISLTSRGFASRLEASVEADVDSTGLQRVMICSEGESELSCVFGPLSLSYQAEWMGWSRDESDNSSIRVCLETLLDPAETRMSLASRELANRLEGSVEVDFNRTELQSVMIRAEGESELSGAFGSLAISFQADWMGWARDESESSSIRLGLEARLDPAESGSTADRAQTSNGSRLRISADMLVDQMSIQFKLGGELTFGWSLLEREAGGDVTLRDTELDFAAAAAILDVSEEELRAALGDPEQSPPNFTAAAAELGVSEEALLEALGGVEEERQQAGSGRRP